MPLTLTRLWEEMGEDGTTIRHLMASAGGVSQSGMGQPVNGGAEAWPSATVLMIDDPTLCPDKVLRKRNGLDGRKGRQGARGAKKTSGRSYWSFCVAAELS
jgi:hypothetical protein